MSGATVVDGIDRYVPAVRTMKERILILRDAELHQDDAASMALKNRVQLSSLGCGAAVGTPARILTVNGAVRPQISIARGERQFWRIVNASPDLYADLEVDSEQMTVIALDGMPLAYHDPRRRTEEFQHILLAPAGRVEAIVTGPKVAPKASLRSLCVDTGSDGDPNPAMVLADLDESVQATPHASTRQQSQQQAVYKPLSHTPVSALEIHPFHIHQVHFLVYMEHAEKLNRPEWMDTVNIEPEGSADLIMDFTDPIIRGMSLFHCHLLKHEDKGMMAKILFQ
jgi:FtsP/CotA-like multicopper oxidase with cupredoxin domain